MTKINNAAVIKAILVITGILENKSEQITNRRLIEICGEIPLFNAENDSHIYHEIVETAMNLLIKNKYALKLLKSKNAINEYEETIKPLVNSLPTQTWRSVEQNKWQQFSTPPTIASFLAYLMNFKNTETILEPSAGTGSLAIWASCIGAKTYTNEIDSDRRKLMEILSFKPSNYNAEFIHDFLPDHIQPDCILMNPPFSSNGGRTKNNSSKFGFRHVESAIERLKPGGKFGIILGASGGLETKTGREFWQKLSAKVSVKAILTIDGKEYSKNGTSVDVNLIIGNKKQTPDKYQNNSFASEIITLSFASVEDGFSALSKFDLRLQ